MTPSRSAWAAPRWVVPGLVAVAVLPFTVAIVSLAGRAWVPASDHALISLLVSDVGGEHTPLVGLGSRGRWAHLGPWMLWVLAPFRWVGGPTGMLVGTAVVHAAAAAATVVVGHRRGGLRLAALLALAIVVLTNSLGMAFLVDPWNPYSPFFLFLLYLVLVWAVLCGDLPMLVPAAAVGSVVAQSHASYLPLVLALGAVAVSWTAVAARRGAGSRPEPGGRRWWRWAAVALALAWLPPIVEQATSDPGNLQRFLEFLREPDGEVGGLDDGLGFFGRQLHPWGPWITGDDNSDLGIARVGSSIPAFGVLALVAASAWWARRRGAVDAASLGLVAVVAVVVGIAASARITGLPVPYLLRWWWAVAALAWVALVHAVVGAIQATSRNDVADQAATALSAGVAAVVAVLVLAQAPAPVPLPELSEGLAAVAPATVDGLDPSGRYLVRGIDTASFGGAVHGLFAELERRGVTVRSDRIAGAELGYGAWRLVGPAEAIDGVITIIARADYDAGAQPGPESELLASYDPLTAAERDRFRALVRSIRRGMGDAAPDGRIEVGLGEFRRDAVAAGAEPEEVEELRRLVEQGEGYVVFLTPGDR